MTTFVVCAVLLLYLFVQSFVTNDSISKQDIQRAQQDAQKARQEYVDGWNWYVDNVNKYGPMACVYHPISTSSGGDGCTDASIKDATTHK